MTVLLQHLWPALALAALLGFGFALVFGPGSRLPSARLDVGIGAILLLVLGLLLSWLEVVPGRPGLWLDIGTLCLLAYALGSGLGMALRWLLGRLRSDEDEAADAGPAA